MATEADIPDPMSPPKREEKNIELVSELSSVTASEVPLRDQKKVERWPNEFPETIQSLEKTEQGVTCIGNTKKGNDGTIGGESFLKSLSVADREQQEAEADQMNCKEGSGMEMQKLIASNKEEIVDNASSAQITVMEQDLREMRVEGEAKRSNIFPISAGAEMNRDIIETTEDKEDEKNEEDKMLRDGRKYVCMSKEMARPDNQETEEEMGSSQGIVELRKKIKDVTSIEEVENNLESSAINKAEDIRFQEVDSMETSKEKSETGMNDIVKDSQHAADVQEEVILENIVTEDSNLSTTAEADSNLRTESEAVTPMKDFAMESNDDVALVLEYEDNVVSRKEDKIEISKQEEHSEGSILQENVPAEEDDARIAINKKKILEEKVMNLSTFVLDEKTTSATHPPIEETVQLGSEKQDEVSGELLDQVHQAFEVRMEKENLVNATHEANKDQEITILEHKPREGAVAMEATSTTAMDIKLEKGQELNYMEELKEINNERNLKEEMQQEEAASDAEFQVAATEDKNRTNSSKDALPELDTGYQSNKISSETQKISEQIIDKEVFEDLKIDNRTEETKDIQKEQCSDEGISPASTGEQTMKCSQKDETEAKICNAEMGEELETNSKGGIIEKQDLTMEQKVQNCSTVSTVEEWEIKSSKEDIMMTKMSRKEASVDDETAKKNSTMDVSATINLPSSSVEEQRVNESLQVDERDNTRAEKEEFKTNTDCVEDVSDATSLADEREGKVMEDEAIPSSSLKTDTITGPSEEETSQKERNSELENSSVPDISEEAEESTLPKPEAEPAETSNLIVDMDMDVPRERKHKADEAEMIESEGKNETCDTLLKTEDQREILEISEKDLQETFPLSWDSSHVDAQNENEELYKSPEMNKEKHISEPEVDHLKEINTIEAANCSNVGKLDTLEDEKSSKINLAKDKSEYEMLNSEGLKGFEGPDRCIDNENTPKEQEVFAKNCGSSLDESNETETASVHFEASKVKSSDTLLEKSIETAEQDKELLSASESLAEDQTNKRFHESNRTNTEEEGYYIENQTTESTNEQINEENTEEMETKNMELEPILEIQKEISKSQDTVLTEEVSRGTESSSEGEIIKGQPIEEGSCTKELNIIPAVDQIIKEVKVLELTSSKTLEETYAKSDTEVVKSEVAGDLNEESEASPMIGAMEEESNQAIETPMELPKPEITESGEGDEKSTTEENVPVNNSTSIYIGEEDYHHSQENKLQSNCSDQASPELDSGTQNCKTCNETKDPSKEIRKEPEDKSEGHGTEKQILEKDNGDQESPIVSAGKELDIESSKETMLTVMSKEEVFEILQEADESANMGTQKEVTRDEFCQDEAKREKEPDMEATEGTETGVKTMTMEENCITNLSSLSTEAKVEEKYEEGKKDAMTSEKEVNEEDEIVRTSSSTEKNVTVDLPSLYNGEKKVEKSLTKDNTIRSDTEASEEQNTVGTTTTEENPMSDLSSSSLGEQKVEKSLKEDKRDQIRTEKEANAETETTQTSTALQESARIDLTPSFVGEEKVDESLEEDVDKIRSEKEASTRNETTQISTVLEEIARIDVSSPFIGDKEVEESLKEDKDTIRSEKEARDLNLECIEQDFTAKSSTEERDVNALKDEAEPNYELNSESSLGFSEEEKAENKSNLDTTEGSLSVPQIHEKVIKDSEGDSEVAVVAEDASLNKSEAEQKMWAGSSNQVCEERDLAATATSEVKAKPAETSNISEAIDMDMSTARNHDAEEMEEKIDPERTNEITETLSTTEAQKECSTVEKSIDVVSEQIFQVSSKLSMEDQNLVTPEVSEKTIEAPERDENLHGKAETPLIPETTKEDITEAADESTDSKTDTQMRSVDIEKKSTHHDTQDEENIETDEAVVEFEAEACSHGTETSEAQMVNTLIEKNIEKVEHVEELVSVSESLVEEESSRMLPEINQTNIDKQRYRSETWTIESRNEQTNVEMKPISEIQKEINKSRETFLTREASREIDISSESEIIKQTTEEGSCTKELDISPAVDETIDEIADELEDKSKGHGTEKEILEEDNRVQESSTVSSRKELDAEGSEETMLTTISKEEGTEKLQEADESATTETQKEVGATAMDNLVACGAEVTKDESCQNKEEEEKESDKEASERNETGTTSMIMEENCIINLPSSSVEEKVEESLEACKRDAMRSKKEVREEDEIVRASSSTEENATVNLPPSSDGEKRFEESLKEDTATRSEKEVNEEDENAGTSTTIEENHIIELVSTSLGEQEVEEHLNEDKPDAIRVEKETSAGIETAQTSIGLEERPTIDLTSFVGEKKVEESLKEDKETARLEKEESERNEKDVKSMTMDANCITNPPSSSTEEAKVEESLEESKTDAMRSEKEASEEYEIARTSTTIEESPTIDLSSSSLGEEKVTEILKEKSDATTTQKEASAGNETAQTSTALEESATIDLPSSFVEEKKVDESLKIDKDLRRSEKEVNEEDESAGTSNTIKENPITELASTSLGEQEVEEHLNEDRPDAIRIEKETSAGIETAQTSTGLEERPTIDLISFVGEMKVEESLKEDKETARLEKEASEEYEIAGTSTTIEESPTIDLSLTTLGEKNIEEILKEDKSDATTTEKEASAGNETAQTSTALEESATIDLPSSFVEKKKADESLKEDKNSTRSEKEARNLNTECIEQHFITASSWEEREAKALKDDAETNYGLSLESCKGSSDEEKVQNKSNPDTVEDSFSVPQIHEKEIKDLEEDSETAVIADDASLKTSDHVLEEMDLLATETSEIESNSSEIEARPAETSNLAETKDGDIPTARNYEEEDIEEKIDAEKNNEISDALSTSGSQRESATAERSADNISEQIFLVPSTVSMEEPNLVKAEVSETTIEASERGETFYEKAETPLIPEITRKDVTEVKDESTNSINVEKKSKHHDGQDKDPQLHSSSEMKKEKGLSELDSVVLKMVNTSELDNCPENGKLETLRDENSSSMVVEAYAGCTDIEEAILEQEDSAMISEGSSKEIVETEKAVLGFEAEACVHGTAMPEAKMVETLAEKSTETVEHTEELVSASGSLADDESTRRLPEANQTNVTEESCNHENQTIESTEEKMNGQDIEGGENEMDEEMQTKLEIAKEINKTQDTILSKKVSGDIERAAESEIIKAKIAEGICTKELHMIPTGDQTENKVALLDLASARSLQVTASSTATEVVEAKVAADLNQESEATRVTGALEDKTNRATERSADVLSLSPEVPEEKIKEENAEAKSLEMSRTTSSSQQDAEVDSTEPEQTTSIVPYLPTNKHEKLDNESIDVEKSNIDDVEIEEATIPDAVAECKYEHVKESHETDTSLTVEESVISGAEEQIIEVPQVLSEPINQGFEVTADDEIIPVAKPGVEVEEIQISDAVPKSRDLDVTDICPTTASPTLEEITNGTEEQISEVPEALTEPRNQGVIEAEGDEITPPHIVQAEKVEEQLQVPCSTLLSKEQDSETTTTIQETGDENSNMACKLPTPEEQLQVPSSALLSREQESETTTTINKIGGDESTNKEVDNLRCEETCDMVSQLPIAENQKANDAIVEKSDVDEDEITETKPLDALSASKNQGFEEIHENKPSPITANIGTDEIEEEIRGAEDTSDHRYEGVDTAAYGKTPNNLEDQLQVSSSTSLSSNQVCEIGTTIESIEGNSTKKDETEVDNIKPKESVCQLSKFPTVEQDYADNKTSSNEESESGEVVIQEIQTSEAISESKVEDNEETTATVRDLTVGKTHLNLAEEETKAIFPIELTPQGFEDQHRIDSGNLSKEVDDLNPNYPKVEELFQEEVSEKFKETNLEFEKDFESVHETQCPEELLIPKKKEFIKGEVEGAKNVQSGAKNYSEETAQADEDLKKDTLKEKIKEEKEVASKSHLVSPSEKSITKNRQADKLTLEDYAGERKEIKFETLKNEIQHEVLSEESEEASVEKNVNEASTDEDRCGDTTTCGSLLEDAKDRKTVEETPEKLEIENQGTEANCRDTATETIAPVKEVSEVQLARHDDKRTDDDSDKEFVMIKDKQLQIADLHLDFPPVTDARAEEAADEQVDEISEEVSEADSKDLPHEVETYEKYQESSHDGINNTERIAVNEKLEHTSSEPVSRGSIVQEDLYLKQEEICANKQIISLCPEAYQEKTAEAKSEGTDQGEHDIISEKQTAEAVNILGGKSIQLDDEHAKDEEAVKLSTVGSRKPDEAMIHSTITAKEVEGTQEEPNILPNLKDSETEAAYAKDTEDVDKVNEDSKNTNELEETSLAISDGQIASKADPSESTKTTNSREAKGVQCGEKKVMGDESEETKEKSKTTELEKISLSDSLQRSAEQTSQVVEQLSEERELADKEEEQMETAETVQLEEAKTDEEKDDDEGDEHKRADSGSDAPVMVEASRDADVKVAHKKSHNILSGVGSKVKHSLAKVKKVITGKSSHPKHPLPK